LLEQHAKPAKPGVKSLVKEGGKGHAEQKFKVSVPVKVQWKDGSVLFDEIKGLNQGHALTRARDNWPDATVTLSRKSLVPKD
jgi:hypothetical protein